MAQPPRSTWPPYNTTETGYFQQQVYNLPFQPGRCAELCCQSIRCPEPLRAYQSSPYLQSIPVPQVQDQQVRNSVPIAPYWPRHSTPPNAYHSGFSHKTFQQGYNAHNYYNLRYRSHPYNHSYPRSHVPTPSPRPQGNRMIIKKPPELDVRQFLATWQDKDEEVPEDTNVTQESVVRPLVRETFQPLDCTMRSDPGLQIENNRDSGLSNQLENFQNKSYIQQGKTLYTQNSGFSQNILSKEVTSKDDGGQRLPLQTDRSECFGNIALPSNQFESKAIRYPHTGWQIAMPCERRIDRISNPNINSDHGSLEMMQLESFNNRRECAGESTNFSEISDSIHVNYEGYKQANEKYNLTSCLETDELFDDINKKKEERQKLVVHPLRHESCIGNFNPNNNVEVSKISDMPHVFVKPTIQNGSRNIPSFHDSVIVHSNSSELSHWDEAHVNMQQRNYIIDEGTRKLMSPSKHSLNLSGDKISPYNYNQDLQNITDADSKYKHHGLEKQINLNDPQRKSRSCSSIDQEKIELNFKNTTSTICTVAANQIKPISQDTSHSQGNDNCFFDSCNLSRDNVGPAHNVYIKSPRSIDSSITSQNHLSTEACLSSDDIDITIASSGDLELMANSQDSELDVSNSRKNREISGSNMIDETKIMSQDISQNYGSCIFNTNLDPLSDSNENSEDAEISEEPKEQLKPLSAHVHPRVLITRVQTERYISSEVEANSVSNLKMTPGDNSIQNRESKEALLEDSSQSNVDVTDYSKNNGNGQQPTPSKNRSEPLCEFDSGKNPLNNLHYNCRQSDGKLNDVEEDTLGSDLSHSILIMTGSGDKIENNVYVESTEKNNFEVPNVSRNNCGNETSQNNSEDIIPTSVNEIRENPLNESALSQESSCQIAKGDSTVLGKDIDSQNISKLLLKGLESPYEKSIDSFYEFESNDKTSDTSTSSHKDNALLSIAYLYEDANISNSSDDCNGYRKSNVFENENNHCILEYEDVKSEINAVSLREVNNVESEECQTIENLNRLKKSKFVITSRNKQNCEYFQKMSFDETSFISRNLDSNTDDIQRICFQGNFQNSQNSNDQVESFDMKSLFKNVSKTVYDKQSSDLHINNSYFEKKIEKKNNHRIEKKVIFQSKERSFMSKMWYTLNYRVKRFNYRLCKQILSKYLNLKKKRNKYNYHRNCKNKLNSCLQVLENRKKRNEKLITSKTNEVFTAKCSNKCNEIKESQTWTGDDNDNSFIKTLPANENVGDSNCEDILNCMKCDQRNDINDNELVENNECPFRGREGQKDINLKCSLRWDKIFNVKDKRHVGQSNVGSELNLGPAKVGVCLVENKIPGQWRVVGRSKETEPQVVKIVKRLIMQPKTTSHSEERVPKVVIKKTGGESYESYLKEELQPTVILERRSEIDILAKECDFIDRVKCQTCGSFFAQEELSRHSCSQKREAHHCCLCQQTFSSLLYLQRHQDTRSHRHLEIVQRNAAHNVHKQMTGYEYPLFASLTSEDLEFINWKPDYPGYTHYYHNAPL